MQINLSFVCGQPFTFTEKEISVVNGGVNLSGTIITPDRSDLVPGIIFLHGSGTQTREGFRPIAESFAKLGIGSIIFDKRGSGSSSGSWESSSMLDLAKDGVAILEFFKKQSGIDPDNIGLWAISQGGWIAPMMASVSDQVQFMIINSGGGASPRESEYFTYQNIFNHMQLDSTQQKRAFQIVDTYFEYLESGKGRKKLMADLEQIKNNKNDPMHGFNEFIKVPSMEVRPKWKSVAEYEPMNDIKNFKGELLLLLGEIDTDHPTDIALKKWKQAMHEAGNSTGTYILFSDAGHGIRKGAGHNPDASFADGYLEVQLGWLWKNILN